MTNLTLPKAVEFDHQYATEQLWRSQRPLRRFIKGFYLRHILRDILPGPCIDFGCGAGQLLEILPEKSEGLEVNPFLISELRTKGLLVHQAQGEMEDFELTVFSIGKFRTLIIAHVLEHLVDPVAAMRVLFSACRRLQVERIVIVVPGAKGYASDRTHKSFINRLFVDEYMLQSCEGFVLSNLGYFPGAWEWIGRYFIFHEMKLVYDYAGTDK